MSELTAPAAAAPASAAGTVSVESPIRVELPCVGCGYVLRGLTRSSRCPECGRPVADSWVDFPAAAEFRDALRLALIGYVVCWLWPFSWCLVVLPFPLLVLGRAYLLIAGWRLRRVCQQYQLAEHQRWATKFCILHIVLAVLWGVSLLAAGTPHSTRQLPREMAIAVLGGPALLDLLLSPMRFRAFCGLTGQLATSCNETQLREALAANNRRTMQSLLAMIGGLALLLLLGGLTLALGPIGQFPIVALAVLMAAALIGRWACSFWLIQNSHRLRTALARVQLVADSERRPASSDPASRR